MLRKEGENPLLELCFAKATSVIITKTHKGYVNHLCYFCLVLLCFHVRLFVDALWSPVRKGLTSLLWFVMSNCDVVTFPLVSWVRCGA